MHPYIIQYLVSYVNYGVPQRPIVPNNNLVKSRAPTNVKIGEKGSKQDSRYIQSKWCPSGLSHTQKRRLQRMRNQGVMEVQVEAKPVKSTQKEWRTKQASSVSN